jgi:hypothetical protein
MVENKKGITYLTSTFIMIALIGLAFYFLVYKGFWASIGRIPAIGGLTNAVMIGLLIFFIAVFFVGRQSQLSTVSRIVKGSWALVFVLLLIVMVVVFIWGKI